MKTLDRYIGRQLLQAISLVLMVVVGLDAISALVTELEDLTEGYTFARMLIFVALTVPLRIYEFIPLACLIGCLVGLGTLASQSELTVMRAAGMSLMRITLAAIKAVAVFMLLGLLLGEYVAPSAEQLAQSERAQQRGSVGKQGLWYRDGERFFLLQAVRGDGTVQGVLEFQFDGHSWHQSLLAERGHHGDSGWRLEGVQATYMADNGPGRLSTQAAPWPVTLVPDLLTVVSVEPEDLSISSLAGYGDYLQRQGLDAGPYRLAFWKKAMQPLATLGLVLVGISFIFGPLRSVTVGQRVIVGVLAGLAFNYAQDILGAASGVLGFAPWLAVLGPIALCLAAGALLLRRAG